MRFQLPSLPFDFAALEPYISAETMKTHYAGHHGAYVQKTNELLDAPTAWQEELSLEEIVKTSSGPLFNSAAQAWNHTFFWQCLTAPSSGKGGVRQERPESELDRILTKDFGSFDHFRQLFSQRAAEVFGSGWVWLVKERTGRLNIVTTANADTPIVGDDLPLLVLDVWEHAYYLDYRNKRAGFIEAFWHLVNWDFVQENLRRDSVPNFTRLMAMPPSPQAEQGREYPQPNV